MRKYITYLTCLIAAALAAGCMDVDINHVDTPAMTTLVLRNSDLVVTRATTDGVTELNENLIANVQCFFSVDGTSIDYATGMINVGKNDSDGNGVSIPVQIPGDIVSVIFPAGAQKCNIYVLANAPEVTGTPSTIEQVKNTAITLKGAAKQDSFVMDGTSEVIRNDSGLSSEVFLTRAAAKIQVNVNVEESIVVGGNTWKPIMDEMELTYNNSVTGSKVSAAAADATAWGDYVHDAGQPFYSYPSQWDRNNTQDHDATISLVIPWAIDGDKNAKVDYIYQFPVNYDGQKIERNNIYKITLNVGVLGGLVEPVELEPSYIVVNWSTNAINAELNRPKYLVVDNNRYVMNNETYIEIPFHTSDPCTIVSSSCTHYKNLTATSPTSDTDYSVEIAVNEKGEQLNYIKVTNNLDNNLYSDTFDFTPYTITLTIQHEADSKFTETITITQYPAIYGVAQQNTDFDNGGDTNADNGFVWVNGYQGSAPDDVTSFDTASGASDDDLNAVSMYIFNISTLAGTDYILGDPRTSSPDNLGSYNFTWASGATTYGTSPRVGPAYYYPTAGDLTGEANNPNYNMIAPKFRVCSAYGQIDTDGSRRYFERVKGRCASYQEDGYPAGRWRLPTKAEFELINTLSNKKLMPTLFVDNMDYWCAHGYGCYEDSKGEVQLVNNDADYGSSRSISVRCVYDDWYWGSDPVLKTEDQKNVFTWGDEPR